MKNFSRKLLTAACMIVALVAPGITTGLLHAQDAPGPRGTGRMGFAGGGGTFGTVTEIASDHLTVKTDTGETYKVLVSVNTRFVKDREPVQSSDLKVGDVVIAMGKPDESAKTVGAVMVAVLDPERARQVRDMQANYGKTWLMGKITAIDETKITITGRDNNKYNLVVDENTSFRKRRDSITLADIKVGDMIRATGAQKNGSFAATELNVMEPGQPRGGADSSAPSNQQLK
jgi:preprotein translocase subunit YajC